MKVLALSSSRVGNSVFLEKALPYIDSFIGNHRVNIAFVPFASVQRNYDEYGAMVEDALASLSYNITIALPHNAKTVIEESDIIVVGGGNTFKLLHDVYEFGLFELIRARVNNGTPYIGWSAGANLSGRSISTTNDMPIIQPKLFTAFGFLPFQINPHYINQTMENHNGETRDQRLEEFIVLNPGIPVIGLPEGTALQLEEKKLQFIGDGEGVLFQTGLGGQTQKTSIVKNEDLSSLLNKQY